MGGANMSGMCLECEVLRCVPNCRTKHASFHGLVSLKGTTSFPDQGLYEYDQIRVSLCLLCLGLLSCIELYIFLCHSVLFTSTSAKCLALTTFTLVISFASKGFPYKDLYVCLYQHSICY